jgi:ketosteroid isomerase-like protein
VQLIQSIFALLLLTLSAVAVSAESDVENIRNARAQYNDAIARHDAAALQSFLDEDYVVTISTGYIQRSRDEYVSSFATHFEEYPDVVYIRTPSEILLSEAYPLAIEHGTWVGSRTDKNGKLENGGQYTAAWRKSNGTWRVYSELFVGLYCHGVDCR